jgi:hypothetical protein
MKNALLDSIEKIHTTELGLVRIQRNLSLLETDIVQWCKNFILDPSSLITRQGKNWYICNADIILTVNAHSYTIITAHKQK